MKNHETTIAQATRTFPAPCGYKGQLIVTAKAYQLGGNQHPHFSVTGEVSTPAERARGDFQAGGCIHNLCAKAWPAIAPVIALHLSNADDGEPMSAEANGFYWLAGYAGGLGEQYHGGSDKTPGECLTILAKHLRVSTAEAQEVADKCREAFNTAGREVASSEEVTEAAVAARNTFHHYILTQRNRWQREATAGLEMIRSLSDEAVTA